MVSTPEGLNENRPLSQVPYVTVKKPITSKSLRQFSEVLDVKKNTSVRRFGAA